MVQKRDVMLEIYERAERLARDFRLEYEREVGVIIEALNNHYFTQCRDLGDALRSEDAVGKFHVPQINWDGIQSEVISAID